MYYITKYTVDNADYLRNVNYSLSKIELGKSIEDIAKDIINVLKNEQWWTLQESIRSSENSITFKYDNVSLEVSFKEMKNEEKVYGTVTAKYFFDEGYAKCYVEVFKEGQLYRSAFIPNAQMVDSFVKYLLSTSIKEQVILSSKLWPSSRSGRYNGRGICEDWHDFEYSMTHTFSEEELVQLSGKEYNLLKRLHDKVSEGLE